MPNKFKYKDWSFVEFKNPRKSRGWDNPSSNTIYDSIYKSGPERGSREERVFERLIDWFKYIDNEPTFDSTEIWDSLDSDERVEWFGNSKNEFDAWWSDLNPRLKHYYTDRLMSDKPMLSPKEDVYKNVEENIPDGQGSVQVTIINDKLAITSSKIEVLENIKIMIEKLHGEIEYEHRTKSLPMNKQSHTFIFDLKK
jgi:hypothetical protein